MGALMGSGVGLTVGFIFGSYSILRQVDFSFACQSEGSYDAPIVQNLYKPPNFHVVTPDKYMLSSAATLGFFLAIGSVIRSDSRQIEWHKSIMEQTQQRRLAASFATNPVYRATRAEALQRMKRRWEAEKLKESHYRASPVWIPHEPVIAGATFMSTPAAIIPQFPPGSQAQIIRASQRDTLFISQIREDAENVLRSWFGTRWLRKWTTEVDLASQLLYLGITHGRGQQSLGEEYVGVWQNSLRGTIGFPSRTIRLLSIVLTIFPAYILSKARHLDSHLSPFAKGLVNAGPHILASAYALNISLFYIRGKYHTLTQRLLGTGYITTIPPNPNVRPPSYALLGVLVLAKLVHQVYKSTSSLFKEAEERIKLSEKARGKLPERSPQTRALEPSMGGEIYLDYTPAKEILAKQQAEEDLDTGK
ncbi:SubName: Full=Uncharacterized protein {ECO:0000313/EMBL:CCA77954.1} [Serendipita indica DSM 11827]|nr:SubName: Full=Uncharacterized protein {ECO:0000313/EMBL:CCA77954.1} [Serendipita indica DSM 11827]